MSEKVLEINGLNCGYGSVQILYDIDLYVDKGEFVTIIGPNGCGKSTLIKTILESPLIIPEQFNTRAKKYQAGEQTSWSTEVLLTSLR